MAILDFLKARASLIVIGSLALGVLGYEWHKLKDASVIAAAQAKPKDSGKRLVLAEGRVANYPGEEVTLGTELGGRLEKLLVDERQVVKAGTLIAEIDVKEQRAALTEARARVREADADLAYLSRERDRDEALFQRNVLAQAAFDKTAHQVTSAERRRVSLLATAARLGTVLEKAKILAPIDGTVTARFADAGEILAPGAALVTIANLSRLRVEAEVGEFDVARVRLGAPVTLRAEGHDGKRWAAVVEEIPDRVVPRALRPLDPSRPVDTRALIVKVRPTEPLPLKLGQRVEVEIDG
jgi:HlyD family secretion protein